MAFPEVSSLITAEDGKYKSPPVSSMSDKLIITRPVPFASKFKSTFVSPLDVTFGPFPEVAFSI
ncbi:MAG: hypothetical protein DWQ49_09525 [Bacteroidetes bacterium]|nr:MAG: hypothetical protein DWQ49_09525 [Bacteroidota bacterium]